MKCYSKDRVELNAVQFNVAGTVRTCNRYGANVCVCALVRVELPLSMDKEKSH